MKTGFACGVFDLFHAGHVLMLKECKTQCDFLVVGLNSCTEIDYTINPGKQKPVFDVQDRKLILESCRYVDEVVVYNNEVELETLLRSGRFQIRFLGEDYRNKPITAQDLKIEIFYTDRSHGKSTSGFRKEIK